MTNTIPFHPLAEMLPMLTKQDFDELVASIKTMGLLEPITLYEEKILDGRNRYRACLEAAIEPITSDYQGNDPIGFVCSKNLHRRHLNPSQRAMAMAQYVTLKHGDVASQKDDGAQAPSLAPIMTASQAARLAQVSQDTIKRAKVVHANGTPTEIADVVNGKSTVKKLAKKIRSRMSAVRARGNLRQGAYVKVPHGYKYLSEAVNPGIDLERNGASSSEVAKKVGISLQTYVCVRDAVLLSKRKDLSERELKTVQTALHEIDETRRVKHAQELMKPLSLKVWGRNGNRYKTDKSRVTAFTESIMFVVTGCTAIADREIPALEKKPRTDTIKELNAAISALTKLRRRLKQEEHS